MGKTHTSGIAHTTYQGKSTGPRSVRSTSAHPHAAACSRGVISPPAARRHTARASTARHASSSTAAATLITQPSVWNVSASNPRASTLTGASQPSCPASSSIPSVGSCSWKYGSDNAIVIAAGTPIAASAVRRRRSRGTLPMHHTTSSSSGSTAVAFTSAPSVRTAIASSRRSATTNANAPAIASATSRSLCPLATEWNRITGFAPKATSANTVRSGQSRRTVHTITPQVARLAAIAR